MTWWRVRRVPRPSSLSIHLPGSVSFCPDLTQCSPKPHGASPAGGIMIVTDPAQGEMDDRRMAKITRMERFFRWLIARPPVPEVRHGALIQVSGRGVHLRVATQFTAPGAVASPLQASGIEAFRWRKHPQLRSGEAFEPLPEVDHDVRSARAAAVRGMFAARGRRYEEAEVAFTHAASEPSIALTELPGFWALSRAGMNAAVSAYETNSRYRDAAALAARLRVVHRPRLLVSLPRPITGRSGT